MLRRTFVSRGLAVLTAAAVPGSRVLAAGAALDILGLDGRQLTLKPGELDELRGGFKGELLTAGDAGYDGARRLWNAAFDRRPALIARCAGDADVQRAVSFAAAHGLLTAVRGGGHSLSGQSGCDKGLVIDVSQMREVRIDAAAREAHVQAGSQLGAVDKAAQAAGMATVLGTVADTGVAGLTLGGGQGRLSRKHGLTVDNLLAVEVVTADGRALRASRSDNPDLYWALRGGGGNFGVATAFTYRLHAITPQLYGGTLTYAYQDAATARRLLRGYADIMAHASDDMSADVAVAVDRESQQRVVEFDVCCTGSHAAAERAVAPLRKLGKPLKDQLGAAPYTKLQGSDEPAPPPGIAAYVKGGLVYGMTPALIDATIDYIEAHPAPNFEVEFGANLGAIARVAPKDTAYWGRRASHTMLAFAFWKAPGDGAAASTAWVRGAWAQLEPHSRGNYVNLASADDRESRVHDAYGENYARLASLKKRYDPANLFHLNANIKPA